MLEPIIEFLSENKEKEVAVALLDAMYRHSSEVNQFDELAKHYFKLKAYRQATEIGQTMLNMSLSPEQEYTIKSNLANVANHNNQPEEALRLIAECEHSPFKEDSLKLDKSYAHFLMYEFEEAERLLREALEIDLDDEVKTKVEFNLGTHLMYKDKFLEGLSLFLFKGRQLDYWKNYKLPIPYWEGPAMPGKAVILYAEAGIGDEIINVRFMEHMTRLGMTPIWFTSRQDIADIFNQSGFRAITNILDLKGEFKESELSYTHPMALPYYLNLGYYDLYSGPYLKTDKKFDKKHEGLKLIQNLKVGVRWQGNPEYEQDLHRSIPLNDLMQAIQEFTYSKFPQYYSIQRDTGLEQLVEFPTIVDLSSELESFNDTLSIINMLDIVITTCTSVAHAAAALGKDTFIFVPISAYYPYCNTWGEKTPWYGKNVTVLRQVKPRDWSEPLKRLNEILIERYT